MNWAQLLQIAGYPVVALGVGLESMGLPAPGETLLLIGAALAAQGQLNIYWVIASAAFGAIVGDNVGHYVGQRYGFSVYKRLPGVNESNLAKGEAFFAKYGSKTVFMARFIPVVRMITPILAGINHMPLRIFVFYNALGGVAWAILMGSVGFYFGKNLALIERVLQMMGAAIVALVALALLLFWFRRRWRTTPLAFQRSWIGKVSRQLYVIRQNILSQGRYRGVAIYLAVLAASAFSLGVLVDAWLDKEPALARLDGAATPWLQWGGDLSLLLEPFMLLGDLRFLLAIALFTAFWQWRQQALVAVGLTLANAAGAILIGLAVQLWFKRPAPVHVGFLVGASIYSFPNLSSMVSTAVFGWLAFLWARKKAWSQQLNTILAVVFVVVATGIVMLYLGTARVSDVLAAWALGILWLGLIIGLYDWRRYIQPERMTAPQEPAQ